MKYSIKQLNFLLFIFFATLTISQYSCSNKLIASAGQEQVITAIDSSRWTFTPTQVVPQNGRSQQVNGSSYSAILKDGKFDVYLPYYGRAFGSVDLLSGRSPLFFSSSNFSIDKKENGNGKWTIMIKPRDNDNVQSMNFTFFNSGTANVDVILTSRSAISFNGSVAPVK